MNIQISPLAAARLKALLASEKDGNELAVRVVPLTSGCGSPSFALELTDICRGYEIAEAEGIRFTCPPAEKAWLDGIVIDFNRENGKFIIHHPRPPLTDCRLPKSPSP